MAAAISPVTRAPCSRTKWTPSRQPEKRRSPSTRKDRRKAVINKIQHRQLAPHRQIKEPTILQPNQPVIIKTSTKITWTIATMARPLLNPHSYEVLGSTGTLRRTRHHIRQIPQGNTITDTILYNTIKAPTMINYVSIYQTYMNAILLKPNT